MTEESYAKLPDILVAQHTAEYIEQVMSRAHVQAPRGRYMTGSDRRYYIHRIPKPDGTQREIQEPRPFLKARQKELAGLLSVAFSHLLSAEHIQGGVKGRGIVTNAMMHRNAHFILKTDIQSFYPSISLDLFQRILSELVSGTFLDSVSYSGRRSFIQRKAEAIYRDRELQKDLFYIPQGGFAGGGFLPTGAPSSPIVANICALGLDYRLRGLANYWTQAHRHCGVWTYSRYFDDIIFSTTGFQRRWNMLDSLVRSIERTGFAAHKRKTRWMTSGSDNMLVTGVNILPGGRLRVPRPVYRRMRAVLYRLAKEKKDMPEEVQGLMSYVYAVNPHQHSKLLAHYHNILGA